MSKKIIIFDFDGVIADTRDIAFTINQHFFPHITKEEFLDLSKGNVYEHKTITYTEDIGKEFDRKQKEMLNVTHLFPIAKLIENVSKTYTLCIISSSHKSTISDFLKSVRLNHCFSRIYCKEDHKSKVEKFKLLFADFSVAPKECLFISDTLGDLLEAEKVGVESIGVSWGYHDKNTLSLGKSVAIVDTVDELEEVISSS